MLHFIIGRAGCGKSHMLMEIIKEKEAAGEIVLAVVPEQFSYEFDRKLYDRLGAQSFNAIETHSFTSLARDIFRRLGGGESGSYMDEFTQTGLIIQAAGLAEGELKTFGNQTARSEFISGVSSIITSLRRNGISAEQYISQCHGLKDRLLDKALDIGAVYHHYEALLLKNNLRDMLTDVTDAAAIANGSDFFAGMNIFIDEFESFTPDQYEMLTVMLGIADEVYIAVRSDSENESELSLFASVGAAVRKVRAIAANLNVETEFIHCTKQYRMKHEDLIRLSSTIFRPVKTTSSGCSEHIHILEAMTPTDEVEYVCATIKRRLSENSSLRCRDIAIVTNKLPEYAGILEHSMERYGLPCHIDMATSVLHTPFMVYLMSLMALLRKREPDTELLLRCGKTGFAGCDIIELARLENYCYIWSIDGSTWNQPFTFGDGAAEVEEVRQKLLAPLERLRRKCKSCVTGADYSRSVYEFLSEEKIGIRAETLFDSDDKGRLSQLRQDFKRVWDSLMDILDVLAFLYETQKCTPAEYFTLLSSMLKTITHAVPPRTLDAVFIGPASTSRLSEPKITFVLGACDGSFPQNSSGVSLFSERDRILLEDMGIIIGQPPEISTADERLAVYKILSSPSEELYLCYPIKDMAEKKTMKCIGIELALSLFENSDEMLILGKDVPTDYYAVTKAAAYYHYIQDFSERTEAISAVQTILCEDDYYKERIDYLRAVHTSADFSVKPYLMEALSGSTLTLTATRLETYYLCPFHYFCKYALGLYERRKVNLGNMERGSLIHACLEKLFRDVPRERFINMSAEEIMERSSKLSQEYFSSILGGELVQNIRDMAALSKVADGISALAVHMQDELRQSDFYPVYLELEISDKSPDFPSPRLMTSDGKPVRIMGIADRVDLYHGDDGDWVRVVDYKSGGKSFSLGNLLYGLDMQMLLYLFAITCDGAKLSDAAPAGVLYLPAGAPEYKDCKGIRSKASDKSLVLRESYKMNGLLLDNPSLIKHMDKLLSGDYIKAKLKSDGVSFDKRSGDFVSENEMEYLRTYTANKVVEAAEGIYSGNAAVSPLVIGSTVDACTYCGFKDVCGNTDKCRRVTSTSAQLKDELMKELNRKESE